MSDPLTKTMIVSETYGASLYCGLANASRLSEPQPCALMFKSGQRAFPTK